LPEIPAQSLPATRPTPRLHARLLALQIQRGLTLTGRLEARGDETVAQSGSALAAHAGIHPGRQVRDGGADRPGDAGV